MKSTSFIAPTLLIAGLLLSGCSGLDDPDDGGSSEPSEFEGSYALEVLTVLGVCADNLNKTMVVDADGDITSTTLNDGTDDYTLDGSVASSGAVDGIFDFTVAGHNGTFDGNMDLATITHCGATAVRGGGGNWNDTSTGCSGAWTACP